MKKKILCSVLILMFTWVAIGALDCGCAYASPIDPTVHTTAKNSEVMKCHGAEESKSAKTEDACCSGCQLESKAPAPPSIELLSSSQNKILDQNPDRLKSGPASVILSINAEDKIRIVSTSQARSVSFYDTPIYLTVQSLLI